MFTISGRAGRQGNAGTDAGRFFGWANHVSNGHWLAVELIGGNGGNGQDGKGSPDVNVVFELDQFGDEGWSDSRTTDPDSYYIRYFTEHGYKNKLVSSQSTGNIFTMSSKISHTFQLYPDNCCAAAATGAGGFGKITICGTSDIFYSEKFFLF